MRRLAATAMCAGTLGLTAPGAAAADGGPMPPQQGGSGVSAPGGDVAYVAVGVGGRTVVQRVRRADATIETWRVLRGTLGVGAIAIDGSMTGLSADGRTLVLAGMQRIWPPRSTEIAVLDARRLREQRRFTLRGYWALDAVSPTGRWLYLIHYMSPRNALSYEVRAYDLQRRRLVTRPVVDPREPGEKMQGTAVTRTMSSDGRWAYTLYVRPQGPPFLHALDTAGRAARCIDLPADIAGGDIGRLRMALDAGGTTLSVNVGGLPSAMVDMRTFAVRRPSAERAVAPRPAAVHQPAARSGDAGGGWPWALTALPLLGFAVVLVGERRRRASRRSSARPLP
jgi:hypothetical protein